MTPTPTSPPDRSSEADALLPPRLARKVRELPNGCWQWLGAINNRGYGHLWWEGHFKLAHRVAYEARNGAIQDGLTLDHECKNPRCVNPDHLRPMSQRDNNMLGDSPAARNARKSACINGHDLSKAKIVIRADGKRRKCMTCEAAYKRRSRANAKQI